MGEDREKVILDEESAVREAVRSGDDVDAHLLRGDDDQAVREAVRTDDDVEGHALISDNLPDANLPDSQIRDA